LSVATIAVRDPEARSLRDSEDLMRSLYNEHRGPLMAFTLGLTGGDRQRAEDVVQETLVRAWRNADKLHTEAGTSLRPWLVAVARRIVIDNHRRRKARPTEVDDAVLATLPAPDEIERITTSAAVQRALQSIGPAHREVLFEMYYRGGNGEQAAAALKVPVGTIKSRVYRALRMLRAALEQQGVIPPSELATAAAAATATSAAGAGR
jgi:RNA polymerase sigma-70 factor, ECF subfamily